MIPSHCAIFNLETTSGGRIVNEENIFYNIIGSHEPGVPVFQLTSYTEDSLTRFQWILGTALQKNLKKRRKVTSIRKKKERKGSKVKKINKKTKCQERFRLQLQRKKSESKEQEVKKETKAKRA